MHRVVCGDNLEVLPRFGRGIADLCLTSPPYARQRQKSYDSVREEDYPDFTLAWCNAVERLLSPTGSILCVVRANLRDGAVRPWLLKTRLHLHEAGFRECQELIWHKPGSVPTGRRDRFRQEHETILWLSRTPQQVYCVPKDNGKESDRIAELRGDCAGFGRNFCQGSRPAAARRAHREGRLHYPPDLKPQKNGIARSPDVFRAGPGTCNKSPHNTHTAQHPASLYRQLVRSCCPPGKLVVDPFAGSGTTMEACWLEGRQSLSIDNNPVYADFIRRRHFDLEAKRRGDARGAG